jgi:hypothetical protein
MTQNNLWGIFKFMGHIQVYGTYKVMAHIQGYGTYTSFS